MEQENNSTQEEVINPICENPPQSDVTEPITQQDNSQENNQEQEETSQNRDFAPIPIKIEDFEREFAMHGCLSEESYTRLEKAGISRELTDMYIAGQQAVAKAQAMEIMNCAGGEDEYKNMTLWAAEHLSEDEKNAFNTAVGSGDMSLAKFTVAGLASRYKAETNANVGNLMEGSYAMPLSGYESIAEMVRDVGDPKYKNDEAYRRKVAQKAARSVFQQ